MGHTTMRNHRVDSAKPPKVALQHTASELEHVENVSNSGTKNDSSNDCRSQLLGRAILQKPIEADVANLLVLRTPSYWSCDDGSGAIDGSATAGGCGADDGSDDAAWLLLRVMNRTYVSTHCPQ